MWSKHTVELLIAKYKQHENLYNVAHPQYLDRVKRSISIYAICKDLKELDPTIDEESVKRKIHTIRTQYMKELRCMENSKLNNFGEMEVYEPKLWCFSQMEFLMPFSSLKKADRTALKESRTSDDTNTLAAKRRKVLKEKEEMANVVVDAFEESGNDLSVLARGWSTQYAQLSRQQRVYARKLISDILFHGCLENIKANTVEQVHNILESTEETIYDPLDSDQSADE